MQILMEFQLKPPPFAQPRWNYNTMWYYHAEDMQTNSGRIAGLSSRP